MRARPGSGMRQFAGIRKRCRWPSALPNQRMEGGARVGDEAERDFVECFIAEYPVQYRIVLA